MKRSIYLLKTVTVLAMCIMGASNATAQWTGYSGLPIAYWDFENNTTRTTLETTVEQQINTTGNSFDGKFGGASTATCQNAGNGLSYSASAAAGSAVTSSGWVATATASASTTYYQFHVNTTGFTGIKFGFDFYAGGTALNYPDMAYSYSTNNGTTFSTITASAAAIRNTWVGGYTITLPAAADNNSGVVIRIYGYYSNNAATCGNNGFMRLDNAVAMATGTSAGTVKTLLDEASYYTSTTSGLTGSVWLRNGFTVTGAGTNITVNNTSGVYMATSQTFAVTSSATVTFGNAAIVAGTGSFSIASGCSLVTANSNGITNVGSSLGSVTASGTRTYNTGANYTYNGTTAQVTGLGLPTSLVSPSVLTINNAAGVTLSQSTTTTGSVTMSNGLLSTSTFVLTVPGTGGITGTSSARYVNGALAKTITGLTSVTYEVGDVNYAPATLVLSSAGTGGTLGVRSTSGLHPNVGTSTLNSSQMANHYWTILNSSATGPATVSPTFTYNVGDILGGSNTTFQNQRYSGGAWLGAAVAATNTTAPYTSKPTAAVALASAAADYIFGNGTPACVAPTAAPTGPIAFPSITSTGGTVSFTNASPAPTGYIIVASTGALLGTPATGTAATAGTACCTNGTIIGVTTTTPATISSTLSSNTSYQISAFAYNNTSCSGGPTYNTTTPTASTLLTCPGVPGTPVNGTITSSSIAISWSAPTNGASSYTVNVYSNAALSVPASGYSVSYAGTTATISGLGSLTQYWYTVTANNASCSSSASPSQTGTTLNGPCSGTPNAGVATTTASSVVASASFTLGLSGASGALNISYQWQSSACGDTWSDIALATNSTLTTTETASTFYRCRLTCANSGFSSTSTSVYVKRISAAYCGAPTVYTCADDVDGVTRFTLTGACGTSISDPTVACFDDLLDHTSQTVKLYPGSSYAGTISAGYAGDNGGIWIDFNDNGLFESTEKVLAGSGIPASSTALTLNVPTIAAGATYGTHRMRVFIFYSVTLASGCNTDVTPASFGNAIDYTVQIVPNISMSANTPLCSNVTLTLTATPAVACGAEYTWSGPSGYSAVTTTNTATLTPTSGTYSFTMTVNGVSSCPSPATATVVSNPAPSDLTGTLSACAGGTSSLGSSPGGGVWSTSSSIATVNTSGLVTAGATGGTTTVSYTLSGCSATAVFSVNAAPGAFSGGSSVCTGQNITLSNTGGPGAWTSSALLVGTVGAGTGVVSGLTAGTTAISYSNACGAAVGTVITVIQGGNITGSNITCTGSSTTLSGGIAGTWASSNGSVATINSSGVVSPVATGTTSINFTPGNGCAVVTRVQTVNPTPTAFTISPSSTSTCTTGPAQLLTAGTSGVPNNMVFGTESTTSTANQGLSSDYPNVYQVYYSAQRCQFMVLASELTAMGYGNGSVLSGMNLRTQQVLSAFTLPLFQIRVAPTASTSLTSFVTTGLTTLRSAANYVPVLGDNIFNFGTTYTWDGTSNLVFEVTFNTSGGWSSTPSFQTWYTGTAYQSCLVYRADAVTDPTTITTITYSYNARPTFTLYGTAPVTPTWASTTGLYTNAGATIAYSGTGTNTVYSLPAATSTYTATATKNGCSSSNTATVTIPVVNTYAVTGGGSYCSGGTGVSIGLSDAQAGYTYSLKNSSGVTVQTKTPVSTGAFSFDSPVTTAGAYTVIGTSSGPGCTGNMSGSATVSINPLPATVTVTPVSPVGCTSVTLTAANGSDGTIYYQGTTSGGTSTATASTTANVLSSGTYYFRAQSAAGCWGTQGSRTATVNPLPDVSNFSVAASSVCPSTASTATVTSTSLGNGTYTVTYDLTGANSATGATASVTLSSNTGTFSIPSGSLATAGSTTVTITNVQNANSCNSALTKSGSFTVNALPATVTGSGAGTFCGSTSIGGSNGSDGTIFYQGTTSNGTSVVLGGSPQTVSSTGTYYFRAQSAAGCWGTQGSVTVSINPIPTAAPTNNGYICNGGTVTLTANGANGASTYSWTGPDSYTAATAVATATPTLTGVYSLTVTNGSGNPGCSPSTIYTTQVTVNAKPTATVANNGPICVGGTVTLTATPGGTTTNYIWTGPNSYTAATAAPTATPTTTATYSLMVTNGSTQPGCTPSDVYTTTVTVKAKPTAAPSNDGYICNGGTVNLTANGANGAATYSWTGSSITGSSTAAATTATPTSTTVYTVTVGDGTSDNGCNPSTQYTTSVTVNAKPTASPTNSSPICNGGTVTLSAGPLNGANTYTWTGTSLSSASTQNPTATPTVTSVYSVVVSDGSGRSGCSPVDVYTTSVTVRAKPTAAPTNDGYICNGGTAQLTANPANGATTFAWSGTPISLATAQNPTANPTVTTTYSLTVTDGTADNGCSPSDVYTTTVTVNAKPTAAPSQNGYICEGGTVTLTANGANGATTYAWTGANIADNTLAVASATPTSTGVYSVSVTDGSGKPGCSPTDMYTVSVTVNAKPIATPVNDGPICNGGTVQLTATPSGGANTYSWTGSLLSSASAENPTATPTVTSTYSLTVSDGSGQPGCSPSDIYTTTVTVRAKPTAAPTNNGYICNGGTAQLTANPLNGATVFAWSGSPISSATDENPTADPTATTTYSLTVGDGSGDDGCAPSDIYTTTVTVNAKPTAAPSQNGYICNGGTVTLTANGANGAATYTWTGANIADNTLAVASATPTVTGVYSVSVTDGSGKPGCSPTDIYTVSVTVNDKPTAAPANDGPICNGGTVQLTANPLTGASTYTWSGSLLSSASAQDPTATPTATATYSLTVTDGSGQPGCAPSDIYTTTVTVKAKPTAAPTNNGYICNGGTATLSANPQNGATVFAWSGSPLSSGSAQNPTADPTSTTTYSLTVADGSGDDGCAPSDIYTTSVTVNAKPVAAPVNSGILCNGGTVTLNAVPSGGANTYTWNGSNLLSTTAQNPTATPITGTWIYSLTVSDGTSHPGCAPSDVYTTSVTVNPAPSLTSASNDGPACVGFTLGLFANGSANVTGYSWAGPVAITNGTTANASVPSATTAATGIYTVTVNNGVGSGCTAVYTTSGTVNNVPTVASITPSTTNMCVGATVNFTAGAVTGTGSLTSYNWTGPNGFSTTTSSGSTSVLTTTTAQSGVYSLSVTYPGTGCTSSPVVQSTAVTVNPLPTLVSISASPTTRCAGEQITLTGLGAVGTGSLISYNWTGPNSYSSTTSGQVQFYTVPDVNASGSYSVSVTYPGTGCTSAQAASTAVTVNPLPTVYNITGGGFYCSGGTGVTIGIEDSDPGISYQLYYGSTADLAPMTGTGNAMDWSPERTAAGTYSIIATNLTTSCTTPMNGTTDVSVGPVPVAYTMTGGGGYCAGGAGSPVGLSNADVGVSYQLYRDGVAVGGLVVPTTAGPLSFGTYTATGSYTAVANPSATCSKNMSGSSVISINPLPNIYTVGGGGHYCSGSTGVHISQDFSVVGINYQLYRDGFTVGTPVAGANSGADYGTYTTVGTYSVIATNATTGCVNTMNGTPAIVMDDLPVVYSVTGGGAYCSGGTGRTVGLANSETGVNYQLYYGSSVSGTAMAGNTGSAITFGTFTASGTYSVRATNSTTGCVSNMSGSATVVINSLPAVYAMNGGGHYCQGTSGVHVGMVNSDLGIDYTLYSGASTVNVMPGAASGLDFGFQLAGTYTVSASNTTTGCVNAMSGSITVTEDPLPTTHNVGGGGTICENGGGVNITLDGSNSSMTYQLYNGATAVGTAQAGTTPLALSFGPYNTAGTYSILATNTGTGCTNAMTGTATINVNPAPLALTMTGGGNYCAGGSGHAVGLFPSQNGIDYQLYRGAATVGAPITGDGNPISFGTFTTAGTYTVLATAPGTLCQNAMSGSATITIDALPVIYNVTGGGSYCASGTGVNVGLSNSEVGVNYQLYNGSTISGSPMSGTGSSLPFGQKPAGTYTIRATNATSSCGSDMSGSATVTSMPVPATYTVTGGGNYCSGGTGSTIGLNGSNTGINYRLYMGATPVGSLVAGTGAAISMGPQTTAGTYSILATDGSSACTQAMSGTATVGINASPSTYSVNGGGHYCSGGTGVAVGMAGSANGVNYQLYRGSIAVGSPVAGNNGAISFGSQTVAGTYTVVGTSTVNSCPTNMTGSATVVIDPLPTAQTMTGGGNYCAGGTGRSVGLLFGNSGINYQLYSGSSTSGSPVAGANASVDFGLQLAGTYTVQATDATTGCTNGMSGTITVTADPLPVVQTVTGGGSFCSNASGVPVGLSGSETGVNYQLYRGSTATGMPVGGTNSAISFGNQTVTGTYTVFATNATTGCTRNMSGNVNVTNNPAPTVYNVTGGGTLCTGQSGYNVGLSGSESNVSYALYNGSTYTGVTLNGNGAALSFGTFTAAGTYTVGATNTGTGCTMSMNGGANIIVNPLPTAQTVTGGGAFCNGATGVSVGLNGSQSGVNYNLYRGSTLVTTTGGTGTTLSFGIQTVAGTYTVNAVNATTGCSRSMTGSAGVTVNALPTTQTMTGGGSFCAGGTGVVVGLSGSQSGVLYQLYSGSTTFGSAAAGTGSSISFGNVDVAGTYTVRATNFSTSCASDMSGTAVVIVNDLPTTYTMTGGGSYCQGGTGVTVGLSGSQSGVNYQLYSGSTTVGTAVSGTGAAISFGSQSAAASYTVLATNASTGCTNAMTGSSTVSINSLPTVFNITGGGTYCVGGNGVNIGISSTTIGVNYQLYNGATAMGSPLAGSGLTADFGLQTTLGTYTILATNIFTGCTRAMNGSTTISTTPLPVSQTVTGGGSYCQGGTGVTVGLGSTENGMSYQLYRGSTITGTAVAGTGSSISFGTQLTAGNYTVQATNTTTGCTAGMGGSATVVANALPVAQTVSGGGQYCSGGTGVSITLNSSQSTVSYQLYNGSTATGSAITGTGTTLNMGTQTAAGTYSVRGTITATGCTTGMSGTAMVTVNALPTAYTVSGGGSYCANGTGVAVGLGGSNSGITYTLYRGSTAVGTAPGTGGSISFGLQTVAGSYSVSAANNTTGCSNNMSGTATVSINALPAAQNVTGGGSYCAGASGVAVGISGSEAGVNYQLYRNGTAIGSVTTGTSGAINFGNQSIAGTYSVSASNGTTGCMADMSGTATVSINALPAIQNVSGGGNYCSGGNGVAIGLESSESGVLYQLYNGSATSGTPVSGAASSISFGLKTAAGTYTVYATNPTTGCAMDMSGSATININPLPTAQTVSGGGSYCAGGTGMSISLSGSGNSISYQLYNGATATGTPVTGTGGSLAMGTYTASGTYSVLATNTGTGCTKAMNGTATISINAQPTVFSMTGGGAYCAGGNGVNIGISGSQSGVNYQLYYGTTTSGGLVTGTGGALDLGLKTAAGTYTVSATNAITGCMSNMTGTATVAINALPNTQTITGGGAYCAGGNGVTVNMGGSQSGVDYQLYNGATQTGIAMSGTGTGMSFGLQTAAGSYSVLATVVGTGCTKAMSGTATVVVNAMPTAQTMTGGGAYCAGGTGMAVGLSGSQTGVSYQLYNGTATAGSAVAGTGSALNFGNKTAAGNYSVVATTSAGCTMAMSGVSTISINTVPTSFTMTGGGNYCAGGTGSAVGLNGSQSGISYQLYNGTATSGTPMAGTGSELDFGTLTTTGTYSVRATDPNTGCGRDMSGTVSININTLPTVYTVSGGGSFCAGGNGMNIALSNSQTGVSYQLYNGTATVGTAVSGITGTAINFGNKTAAGVYTVRATNSLTGCMSTMSGSATITVNELPTVQTMTGGGSICTGDAGLAVGIGGSQTGISYRLYNGSATVGGAVLGTGNAMNLGTFTTAGTYSVLATNTTTGCTSAMSGTKTIVVNTLPTVQTLSGGGSYCAGGAGVYVTLGNSQAGVNYQLYKDGTAFGTAAAGTGSGLNFGRQTEAGVYTAVAMNALTGCSKNMSGSATVSITALPVAQNVTGGGDYCTGGTGAHVGLEGSQTGVSYQLYVGSTVSGTAVAGTGNMLDLGARTTAGIYTVKATNTAGCINMMSGSVTINVNALPGAHNVTGGGSYCTGGNGVVIGTDGSDLDVNYILYRGTEVVATVAGTNGLLSFGQQTAAGNYTVVAHNAITGCTRTMTGTASVAVDALPNAYNVVASANSYCAGGTGVTVTLSNSQAGTTYMLYNGTAQVGTQVGTGTGAISFGNQMAAGTYTVRAINNTTGCTSNMSGSATISINELPVSYAVNGGGTLCEGGAGVAVGLASSQAGISYMLKQGGTTLATATGTNNPVSFGTFTTAGTYNVVAMNTATGCTRTMSGTATVVVNALPTTYDVIGGGSYCAGGNGLHVGLGNSQSNVSYQLFKDGTAIGTALTGSNGSAIDLGIYTGAGTYTIMAQNTLTSCSRMMSGAATISINVLPDATAVTGGGSYCAGGTGVAIGIANAASGISYKLYRGTTALNTVTGNGPTSFGTYTATGTYSVLATNTATGCMNAMSGTATVSINALPVVQTVNGGGSYCAGGTGVAVGLVTSQNGVNYQLYMGGTAIGAPVAGNGSGITFGEQVAAGTYSVVATSTATCIRAMSGTATVSITPVSIPAVTLSSNAAATVCSGTEVTYTATAVNSGTSAAYQWMVNGTAAGAGATAFTYAPANGDVVSIQLTSSAACAMPATASASMTMAVSSTVTPVVSITADHSGEICRGTSVTFSAAAVNGGDTPVYSWMRNGAFQGAGPIYTVAPNDGDVVYCMMTSNAACRTTNTVSSNELTNDVVDPLTPVVQITADATVMHEGQPVTFTATLSGAGLSPEVQWLINGKEVSGATTLSFITSLLKDKDTVSVRVMTTGPCGEKFTFATVVISMSSVGVAAVVSTADMDVRIVPNPNNGVFTIKGSLGTLTTETVQAEVTNMLGQVVYTGSLKAVRGAIDHRIELDNSLANGSYLLRITAGDKSSVHHVSVSR